tara:strand:- start:34 stop:474 length:441 start_codon:yes stop_codon:yes gene_type:complete
MIVVLVGLLCVAFADWKYKYNHFFTPEMNSDLQFGFQRGFSVGFSPLEQGPLLSTSYTYLTRMQLGIGLEQVVGERFSIRAQLLHDESGFGGKGEFFIHFEPLNERGEEAQTKGHHGVVASASMVGSDWFVGVGYHFGFSNLNFER